MNTISTLFTNNINNQIVRTIGDKNTVFKLKEISTRVGVMKNGEKQPYITLVAVDDQLVVLNLHPQVAKKLLNDGQSGNMSVVEVKSEEVKMEQVDVKKLFEIKINKQPLLTYSKKIVNNQFDLTKVFKSQIVEQFQNVVQQVQEQQVQEQVVEPQKKLSKKAQALMIVRGGWAAQQSRKEIINILIERLSMTSAGASTYYQNIKSGMWS